MSLELRRRIFDQLDSLVIVDPHTHINPLDPASHSLADILGYHYYTELAHSAGLPQAAIEDPSLSPKDKVGLLIENLGPISNTIQWSWFVEMAQKLFGFQGDNIDASNWSQLYDDAEAQMAYDGWAQKVLDTSKLSAVFLTNEFDDPLEGFDTNTYIPCLRTDDLVFHLAKGSVRDRLERFSGIRPSSPEALRQAIGTLFDHFISRGARACAISLPPDFAPQKVSAGRAASALEAIEQSGVDAADTHKKAIANFVFWTLCEYCSDYGLPFDLMIGVNRAVYPAGVHQGRDLYDSRVSLHQYKEAFNAFPGVKFPLSVLASVTNQELTSYAWIFPNVITSGHWWYSNTPTFIEHDLGARLEAVPRTKQIGYYSDMYKLEFALPKFAMYKRCLAKVLAEKFVQDRGWSEEQAVALGTQVLQGNTESIFPAVPMDKVIMRREEREAELSAAALAAPVAAAYTGGFPDEGDTFDSVAGPKLGDIPTSSHGSGLPIGGVNEGSLASLATASLLPGSFDERIEPTIHMDQAETEHSAIHTGALSPEVHLPIPHFAPTEPQTEEDLEALDDELALDPEWKQDLHPSETDVPHVHTGDPAHDNMLDEQLSLTDENLLEDKPATGDWADEPLVAGEMVEAGDDLVLENFDETPLAEEEPLEISLEDPTAEQEVAAEQDTPEQEDEFLPQEFTARETVVFDPTKMFGQKEETTDEIVFEEEEIVAAEAPTLKASKPDDFDDMLDALDLEPEKPDETEPPKTNDPPKADPDNPWAFLKK
ncbi:glucuronate isomerase [Anatilimnocola aggregata]|uniref:Glucuronate isomerase n=1 Tax=Anatilimnocola aggregata TaxID=2528021 RepID=A0A517Y7H4_9BACT|nr:glucuronate isomerase [Anatilimnocola aggregata]QDU26191.1 glucuronate isomerase [Anatilimnocola aggregata]